MLTHGQHVTLLWFTYYLLIFYLKNCQFIGKCSSSSAAGETSPPAGFVYNEPADKYYAWLYDYKSWYNAQVQCSAQEATLIEAKTAEEHEVFPVMRSKICAHYEI